MSQPYPIVSQRQLKEPPRRGPLGLGGHRRPESEMPALNPHEVRVYRVGGQFIVDDGRRGPDDNRVVNATSVSVVNMRRGADVGATFEIASKDAAKFTVQVNFVCSVVDPVTVVRDGQTDASESLLAYLKGYQPLFELGLKHPLAEINAVRREGGLHVKAYMTIRPPEIPGMSIALANVQVMTPQELAQHEERRRKEGREQSLAAERMRGEQTLKQQQQQGEHVLKEQQQEGDQVLKEQQQEGDQVLKERQQEGDQVLKERQQASDGLAKLKQQENEHLLGVRARQHSLDELGSVAEAIGNDVRLALLLAYSRHEVSADDVARRLRQLDEEDRQHAQEVKGAKRLARERAEEILRADAKEKAALDREDSREADAIKRADTLRELEWARTDKREETKYDRAMGERAANEARELHRQKIDVELEIMREFTKRGLLDNYYLNADDMMRRLRGEPAQPELPPAGSNDGNDDPQKDDPKEDDPKEDDLKEEDGY
jgi:hypothetical protein